MKHALGAARNMREEALPHSGHCTCDTGSKMDDVIYATGRKLRIIQWQDSNLFFDDE